MTKKFKECDGFDSEMNLNHALNYKTGGTINMVTTIISGPLRPAHPANALNTVEIEPILQEANVSNNVPALQVDFKVN